MKSMLIVAAILFCTFTSFGQDVNSFIELLKSDIKADKQLVITQLMQFTQTEPEAFRPVYNEFEYELDKLSDKSIANIADGRWGFLIEPYLMFPNMSGQIGIENLPIAEVDANPADIFDKLNLGLMLYLEAHNNQWAITSDLLYMNLKQDVTPRTLIISGEATAKQLAWEISGLYRLTTFLEAGIGVRYNSINSGLDIQRKAISGDTTATSADITERWTDPIIITRIIYNVDNKWLFQFRGDLGGFNIGSAFTWQIQGYIGYRFSELFQLTIGYRYMAIDYDEGTGEDRFKYDMSIFGPMVKLGFNFYE